MYLGIDRGVAEAQLQCGDSATVAVVIGNRLIGDVDGVVVGRELLH